MVRLSKRQPPVPAVCVLFRLIWNSICNQNAFFLLMNRYTCASTQSLYVTLSKKTFAPILSRLGETTSDVYRRIHTAFIFGTALLNFGTRANNMGHGLLDFCRLKANFSARVPKNLGGLRPPQEVVPARLKRGLRAETGEILVPIEALPSELTTKAKALGSKISF